MTGNFSKRDTSILKGFAILCIVFHNYFHWLWPSPGENEFSFSMGAIYKLFEQLHQYPGEWFNLLFSYFGHYGVQLFVMVSGYGLVLSMMNRSRSWGAFVLDRLKKLYPLLLTAVIVYFFECVLVEARTLSPYEKTELGYKLLFIHTLLPNSGLSVNGPWWFFGLIFQLYLLFPLLYQGMKRWGWKAFWVVLAVSYGLIFLFREYIHLYQGELLMQNAPGHLPEFCFGMMLAFSKDKNIHWGWLLMALVLFVWGNFAPGFYPFTFLSVCVIAAFAYQGLKSLPFKKHWLSRLLAYFGGVSMTLFAVHGFFRTPVLKWAYTLTTPLGHFWSGLVFLLIVWGVALAAKPLYDFLIALFNRIHLRESRASKVVERVCQVCLCLFFAFVAGYYVAQALNRYNHEVITCDINAPAGTIDRHQETVMLANRSFDQRLLALSLKVSFDVCSLDTTAKLPLLVISIPGMLWKSVELPAEYNTDKLGHYEYTEQILCPFVQNTKHKRLEVYFSNREKGIMEYQNAKVEIKY